MNLDHNRSKRLIKEILRCDSLLEWSFRGFEDVPEELLHFGQNIEGVHLHRNIIKTVPDWLSQLKKLALLKLSGNAIRKLPESFTRIRNLVILDLQSNNLTELPEDIDCLSRLSIMNIRDNMIKRLPERFVELKSLTHVDACGNELTKLPRRISNLKVLEELLLDNNRLTSLPQDIVYLPNLKCLSLENNELHYMPFNKFTNQPAIFIKNNRYLHYVSNELGGRMARAIIKIDAWHIDVLEGCAAEKFDADKIIHNRVVYVPRFDKSLVLPKQLQNIHFDEHNYKVPSLYELTLRNMYKTCYKIGDRRACTQPDLLQELPQSIRDTLEEGSTGTCHVCQTPIFTYAFIMVASKSVFSRGEVGDFLASYSLCSLYCFRVMQLSQYLEMCPEMIECKLLQ